jgi:hypothetical protein
LRNLETVLDKSSSYKWSCSGRSPTNFVRVKHGLDIRQKAWIYRALFQEWICYHFCPAVMMYLSKNSLAEKEFMIVNMLKATQKTLMNQLMGW